MGPVSNKVVRLDEWLANHSDGDMSSQSEDVIQARLPCNYLVVSPKPLRCASIVGTVSDRSGIAHDVYSMDIYMAQADWLFAETTTMRNADAKNICSSKVLASNHTEEPKVSLEDHERMADLTPLDFSRVENREFSEWVLEWAPRLLVVKFLEGPQDPKRDADQTSLHDDWVNQLIEWQTIANRKFMLISHLNHPAAISNTVMSCHYSSLQWTNHGFIGSVGAELGVFTNVDEIDWTLQDMKEQVTKRHGVCEHRGLKAGERVLQGALGKLHSAGYTQHDSWEQDDAANIWKYPSCAERTETRTINAIYAGIQTWLIDEANTDEWWLTAALEASDPEDKWSEITARAEESERTPAFPVSVKGLDAEDDDTTVRPGELAPAAGETLDEEVENCMDDDHKTPLESEKRELYKIHRNLGHPQPNDFGRALRHAGTKRHLIRWAVRELKCPTCAARKQPVARRPGTLPRCLRFNQTIGADLIKFKHQGFDKILMNVVCWGTGYQMACEMPDATSESARDAIAHLWIKHYGWPDLLVTDQGPEFTGHEFSTYFGENGVLHHFIDSQSPWQQGRTERVGGSLQGDIMDVMNHVSIITAKEFELTLTSALDARNRYENRSGFSAHQRVFGSSLRLPGSLKSDDFLDRMAMHEDPSTEFARTAEIRDQAQRSYFREKDKDVVQKAQHARTMTTQFRHSNHGLCCETLNCR